MTAPDDFRPKIHALVWTCGDVNVYGSTGQALVFDEDEWDGLQEDEDTEAEAVAMAQDFVADVLAVAWKDWVAARAAMRLCDMLHDWLAERNELEA